jgi:DNA-binding CsgD family transcriptional regulator
MTLALTSADQQALARVSRLMTSPLDHPSADAWRAAVNRELRALMVGDSAAFILPGAGGPVFFSEEHDPAEGAKYVGLEPPALSTGQSMWERAVELRVITTETLYANDVGRYFQSGYYNEYAGANGARRALAAMLPLAPGKPTPTQMANVSVWRSWTSGKNGGSFGDRERQLLQLLFPSLQAGIKTLLQWQQHRVNLLHAVDILGQAVLVCDQDGAVLHETQALTAVLSADAEAESVRAALLRIARAHRIVGGPGADLCPPVVEIRTAHARYRLRVTVYGTPLERQPLTLVSLERLSPPTPSAEEARRRFGLTPSEVRVALLLAEGRSNAYVADALGVRESTARRHTEHVLAKLKVRTRAAVGPRLLSHYDG